MYNSDDILKFLVSAKLLILVKVVYVEVLTQDNYSTLGISPTLKFVTRTGTNLVVGLICVSTSFSFSNEKKNDCIFLTQIYRSLSEMIIINKKQPKFALML